jgi:hypothetical protein
MKDEKFDFTYPNKGIWNSYIIINEKQLTPEQFKGLIPKKKKYGFNGKKDRIRYDYGTYLENIFDMSGGITYFEPLRDVFNGKINGIKVGNDYNHIWNGGESYESILRDVEKVVDNFIKTFPEYKVWDIQDGIYRKPVDLIVVESLLK